MTGPGRGEAGPVVLGRHGLPATLQKWRLVSIAPTASPYLVPPRQQNGAPTGLNSRVGCISRTPLLQAPCQPRWASLWALVGSASIARVACRLDLGWFHSPWVHKARSGCFFPSQNFCNKEGGVRLHLYVLLRANKRRLALSSHNNIAHRGAVRLHLYETLRANRRRHHHHISI